MIGTADSWGIALKPQILYLYIVGKLLSSCTSELEASIEEVLHQRQIYIMKRCLED
jgi:hypothetical protein